MSERSCPFLAIPAELRLPIYYVIFKNKIVLKPQYVYLEGYSKTTRTSAVPNILLTCKTCYTEAKLVFYNEVVFVVDGPTPNQPPYLPLRLNAEHVFNVLYRGPRRGLLDNVETMFPNLKHLEIDLGVGFFHSDQTDLDRAVKYIQRYDGDSLVRKALEYAGHVNVDDIQRLQKARAVAAAAAAAAAAVAADSDDVVSKGSDSGKRQFTVKLRWGLDYRFLEFRGFVDIDEWVLTFTGAPSRSHKVYQIPQLLLCPDLAEADNAKG